MLKMLILKIIILILVFHHLFVLIIDNFKSFLGIMIFKIQKI